MSQTILERLDHLRRGQRRLIRLAGWSTLAVTLLFLLLIAGTADAVIHLDDPGVRLIELIALILAVSWIAWTRLLRPLSRKPTDVQLSLAIERRFPELRDLLSSAAQFQQSGFDPNLGSAELQQDLTDRIETRLQSVPLDELLDSRPVRSGMLLALLLTAVAAAACSFAPQTSSLALRRLALPFAHLPWPKQFQLDIVDRDLQPIRLESGRPIRRVQGESWELCIINRNGEGTLPPDLELLTRKAPGEPIQRESVTRSVELRSKTNPDLTRESGILKLTIRETLEICAVGGDDHEERWMQIETVPPPLIEEFKIEVQPPPYLNLPALSQVAGQGKLEVLAGSNIRLTARSNRPLQNCDITVKGTTVAKGTAVESSDSQDPQKQRRWTAQWILSEPGTFPWHWSILDLEGFSQPDPPKFEVTVLADKPPEIRLDQPTADLRVTPQAEVLFKVTASDDLGLKSLSLHSEVVRGGMSADPDGKPLENPVVPDQPLELPNPTPRTASVEKLLKLADYSLVPEDRLTITFLVSDAFPGPPPHLTKSAPRQIFIVSPEEKLRELADAQSALLNELERASNSQTDARNQVRDLQKQWEKADQLRPQDRDLLQRTEMQQRQVASELNLPGSGIASRAEELIRQHKTNKLTDDESIDKLQNLADELRGLGSDQLPRIEDALTQARKQSGPQAPSPDQQAKPEAKNPPPALDSLKQAEERQTVVQGKLRELVQDLTEWRDQRYAARQVEEIIALQEQTAKETDELAKRTLGKGMQELTPQDEADLARMAERQRQHAERFEQLQQQLADTLGKRDSAQKNPADKDPSSKADSPPPEGASELKDFLDQAEKLGTLPLMRGASRDISSNSLGEANKTQQESLQQLQQLADILRDRPEQNTDKLVEQLREAQDQLKDIRQRQADLQEQTAQLESLADPQEKEKRFQDATNEQQQLQESAERLGRRLKRLQAEESGELLGDAAGKMQQAERSLDNELAPNALDQQEQAEESLETAQRRLEQSQRQMEQRQAQEKVATVRDLWKGILVIQQEVLDQTEKLNLAHEEKKQWNRIQLKALSELATKQNQIVEASGRTAEFVAPARILSLSLKRAIQSMEGARDLLADRQTGKLTQDAQIAARDRLKQILEAFEQQQQGNQQNPQHPSGGGEGQQPQDQGEQPVVPPLAELKILRSLQQELNQRTDSLSQELAKAPDNANTLNNELDQLGREQEELLQLLTETLDQLRSQQAPQGMGPRPAPIPNAPQAAPTDKRPAASLTPASPLSISRRENS